MCAVRVTSLIMKRPPIRPLSVIRLSRLWPRAGRQGHEAGELWRVGYYSKMDGLDVIWLVDAHGRYAWTIDEAFLKRHFVVIEDSGERSVYGTGKPDLPAVKSAPRSNTEGWFAIL